MKGISYKIDHEILQNIVNYLARMPYGDVYGLIDSLSKLEEIKMEAGNDNKISDSGD